MKQLVAYLLMLALLTACGGPSDEGSAAGPAVDSSWVAAPAAPAPKPWDAYALKDSTAFEMLYSVGEETPKGLEPAVGPDDPPEVADSLRAAAEAFAASVGVRCFVHLRARATLVLRHVGYLDTTFTQYVSIAAGDTLHLELGDRRMNALGLINHATYVPLGYLEAPRAESKAHVTDLRLFFERDGEKRWSLLEVVNWAE